MEARIDEVASPELIPHGDLLRRIEDLEEQLRMSRAFVDSPDPDADVTLHWRGQKRFLTETIIPVKLQPIEADSFHPERGPHWIVDGDNLGAMQSLLTDFRGGPTKGFDVIYMDPPYNTGKDTFSYNDDYRLSKADVKAHRRKSVLSEGLVSLEDPTRHTKWINHMAPRLWAARKLMKSTGVIIVSIDEHELPRLWMLMEQIFLEKNRIATLVWERARKNDANYISEGHEYMLVWARDKEAVDAKLRRMVTTPEWKHDRGKWRRKKAGADAILTAYAQAKSAYGDDVGRIQKALDEFFADLPKDDPARKIRYKKVDTDGVYNDDGDPSWPGGGGPDYDIPHPVTGEAVKKPERGWLYQEDEMKNHVIPEGRLVFKKDHTKVPRIKTYLHEMENEVQTSVIARVGQRAVETVESILGKGKFTNPKDHEMLAELFNLVTWRDKQAVILDPYAGAGTTGHAVLSMNMEGDGSRRFVLIDNGDPNHKGKSARNRYTAEVTAERVRRVITGDWADGKDHPPYDAGYTFFRAWEQINRRSIMSSTRESLADIILQVVEEDSNRIDYRFEGYDYLIGRTRTGHGIALVWGAGAGNGKKDQRLTLDVRNSILDEAEAAGVDRPVYIYATVNTAPINDGLYRFCQIPNSILVRLGIQDLEDEEAQ